MIQIEIIEKETEQELVNDVNYFLEQLENHLFVDIKYSTNIIHFKRFSSHLTHFKGNSTYIL